MAKEKKIFRGDISNIDLRMLRIFKAVVECGGFAAAEVALNISRSAISVAVSDFEKRLKMTLCQRGRAGFVLTDEGKGVYESILQLFTSLETFKAQVNGMHAHLIGDLNIGIADNLVTMEHMHISSALAALKQQGPEVRINIKMATPRDIESGVIDGELHVGVVPQVRTLPSITYHELYDEVAHLYCCDGHPLFDVAQLSKDMVTSADTVISNYAQSSKVKEIEQHFNDTAEASDREGIAFLIFTGAYIGFLPTHYAKHWVEAGRLKALMPEEFNYKTTYAAITRQGARPNRVLDTFMEKLLSGSKRH